MTKAASEGLGWQPDASWTPGKRNLKRQRGRFRQEETGWSREVAVGKSDPESLTAERPAGARGVEPGKMGGLFEEGSGSGRGGGRKMACLGPLKSARRL